MRRVCSFLLSRLSPVFVGVGCIVSCVFLSTPALSSPPEQFRSTEALFVMGTLVQTQIYAPDQNKADALLTGFERELRSYETLFTVHGDGPVQRINQQAGSWVDTPCRVARVIRQAKSIARASDSAFEPTIGPIVNAWKIGFGGDREPDAATLKEAVSRVDYRRIDVQIRPSGCRVRIGEGQSLDLGAIAKGWIGTALVRSLKRGGATRAMVDLGGNIALLGNSPKQRDWNIGVQSPADTRGTPLAVIRARDESVITSGDYERNFTKDGQTYGHILDARTGRPSTVNIGSVTIVDRDGARADAWCTALFAMGLQKTIKFMTERADLQVFLVDAELKNAWVSAALARRLKLLDETIQLHVIGK